jgi:RND family efflux transporter MFP subunit
MAQGRMPMAVAVKMETLQDKVLRTETEYVGVLKADQLVTLKPEMDGIVRAILVQEGDFVEAGMPILRLKAGRDRASVQQAIANVEAAKAATVNTQAQLSATKAEKVEARVETLTQRIAAAEASINQAKANLNQNQSALAIATKDLQETVVTAPISGTLGDLSIKTGDYVERADTIGTITQNQKLNLDFFVPIEQAPKLRLGLPIELIDYRTLEVIGRGQVSFIAPEVDFTSQSILAKASFENPEGRLFTGQLVKAKVIWQQQLGLSVPVTAISRIGGETFIFVAQPNPKPEGENPAPFVAVQKSVTLGKIEGDRYQVLKGLAQGEKIITTGILNLNDGVPVSPADATTQP